MDRIFDINNTAQWLESFGIWAIIISLLLNIVISILGVLPSVFLSGANAIVFGLPIGFAVSLIGEVLGAFVTYVLYRRGILSFKKRDAHNHQWSRALVNASPTKQFILLFTARIMPFVPSGLVTFIAAWTRMNMVSFMLASTLGKAPSIAAEVWFGKNVFKVISDML